MTIEELSKLSDEDLRLECASLCGWRKMTKEEFKIHGVDWINDLSREVASHYDLPMYPQNLNAMAKAEETLSEQGRADYADELFALTDPVYQTGVTEDGVPDLATDMCKWLTATARQRCIAFIAVMQSA